MEFSDNKEEFNERKDAFQDIDISNKWEVIATIMLCCLGNYLIYKILFIIQNLFLWEKDNKKNNPKKMLKINCLLLAVVITKIFSYYYGMAGYIFSKMWLWTCEDTHEMTINRNFYVTIQITEAQTLNLTFCYCSYIWLQLLSMKLDMESKGFKATVAKQFQNVLIVVMVTIPIFTILSIILLYSKQNGFERFALGGVTIFSAATFVVICVMLHFQLKDQYDMGETYRTLKILSVGLIICVLVRPTFNFLQNQNFIMNLKHGEDCSGGPPSIENYQLPDTTATWSWTFVFLYNLFTDLIPVWILSIMFSPNFKKERLMVNPNWDTE